MRLKFQAKGACPTEYTIDNETINGIDLSVFPEGGKFIGDDATRVAGIYDVTRDESGALIVTLGQRGIAYEINVPSHNWQGDMDTLIDAADYSPDVCYIIATSKPESAVYKRTELGWTVAMPEREVDDELV